MTGTRSTYLALIAVLLSPMAANADPIDVTFSVSGDSGSYLLDFIVTNNLADGSGDIYFFGVLLSGRNIQASPTSWSPDNWPSWDNTFLGGCCIYNNNWIDFGVVNNVIQEGTSLGGFQVMISDLSAPTSVSWFAYAFNGFYEGDDPFVNNRSNPGFEGGSSAVSVPEPSTLALLGIGLFGMGLARRNKKA